MEIEVLPKRYAVEWDCQNSHAWISVNDPNDTTELPINQFTEDVLKRLEAHNHGQSSHTSKYKPWKLFNYFAFESEVKAKAFEKYLKSGSGRAFAKKHF